MLTRLGGRVCCSKLERVALSTVWYLVGTYSAIPKIELFLYHNLLVNKTGGF